MQSKNIFIYATREKIVTAVHVSAAVIVSASFTLVYGSVPQRPCEAVAAAGSLLNSRPTTANSGSVFF